MKDTGLPCGTQSESAPDTSPECVASGGLSGRDLEREEGLDADVGLDERPDVRVDP